MVNRLRQVNGNGFLEKGGYDGRCFLQRFMSPFFIWRDDFLKVTL